MVVARSLLTTYRMLRAQREFLEQVNPAQPISDNDFLTKLCAKTPEPEHLTTLTSITTKSLEINPKKA